MNKSHLKIPPLNFINNMLITLPSPLNISYLWNLGSLLGFCLMIQVTTGLILSMHYSTHSTLAFESLINIIQNINYGWLIRYMHLNTASLFFLSMFIHIGRNLYFNSFKFMMVWNSGIIILFLSMTSAFLGYILPWGQMSYWGATVITNLVSTIPYLGSSIVLWLWGGFSVDSPTLNRFFSLHFLFPLVITLLVSFHLMFLHETGSSNPLGVNSNLYKIYFHPFFSLKDLISSSLMFIFILLMILLSPNFLNDPENFIKANPMITPNHIQPEWYFLFAYAILRSIPNKLGGIIALLMSILILTILPFISKNKFNSLTFYPSNQILFWFFVNIFIVLTWLGMKEIKFPFTILNQIFSLLYFSYFILNSFIHKWWDYYLS